MDEEILFKAFVGSFNALVENKEHFMEKWKADDRDELKRYKAKEFIGIVGVSYYNLNWFLYILGHILIVIQKNEY